MQTIKDKSPKELLKANLEEQVASALASPASKPSNLDKIPQFLFFLENGSYKLTS